MVFPRVEGEQLLPLRVEQHTLPQSMDGGMVCRWFPEVEFAVIRSGEAEFQANGEAVLLQAGDGLFFNADCLHTAWASNRCVIDFISFPAQLACGPAEEALAAQYAAPLLDDAYFSHRRLESRNPRHAGMLALLERVARLERERPAGYELLCKSELCALWASLWEERREAQLAGEAASPARELPRLRQGLELLHKRYAEKLSLDSIAAACGVSKSECCRLFQRVLRQTPFDYLLRYRVHRSIPLLLEGALSITEIAWITGFSGASYFSEIFRRYYGCAPTEYRKAGGFPRFEA